MSQKRVDNTRRHFIKTAAAATLTGPFVAAVEASADTSEEYAVALRVREIAGAEDEKEDAAGWNFLIDYVDDVMGRGSDQICPAPESEFFPPVFVKAVREIGRDHPAYVELKGLIAMVDAGADLAAMAEKTERAAEADIEQYLAERAEAEPDRYARTAERVAVLLESPDTPEPLRGMLRDLVNAYTYNVTEFEGEIPEPTPEYIRETLPKLLEAAEREGYAYTDLSTVAVCFSAGPFGE